ncbi:MAG: serine hydrolase domain-containing protein [Cypionkella sp.]
MRPRPARLVIACGILAAPPLHARDAPPPPIEAVRDEIRANYDRARTDAHAPGVVYGVVKDGELVVVEGLGVRDTASARPVDADTRFRIASMSKAFTALAILHLRDQGRIALDAPAVRYIPQLASWKLPTRDARPITVADLLHHQAGLATDDPWGDRQQVLSEGDFTALIASGVDFASAPGVRMEYSNYGYALLGRIVTNVSGQPYQQYIRETIMLPLGMMATGYDVLAGPQETRALGYRWQDERWVREPDMRDGAFGAMGGVETTARDYARWIAFLLSAWPPRDEPDDGPVRRVTVRELVGLVSYMPPIERAKELGPPCRQSIGYGAGLRVIGDCELGRVLTHGGGYPGYGSNMLLLPEAGVGAFVFTNKTYTGLGTANFNALLILRRAGAIPDRPLPVSVALARAYALAKRAWVAGSLDGLPLAGNVALDKDLPRRARELAEIKRQVGECPLTEAIAPVTAMEGRFTWACAGGSVTGRVLRAPTADFQLQVLDFAATPRE